MIRDSVSGGRLPLRLAGQQAEQLGSQHLQFFGLGMGLQQLLEFGFGQIDAFGRRSLFLEDLADLLDPVLELLTQTGRHQHQHQQPRH